jgi:AraC-binding-like domain
MTKATTNLIFRSFPLAGAGCWWLMVDLDLAIVHIRRRTLAVGKLAPTSSYWSHLYQTEGPSGTPMSDHIKRAAVKIQCGLAAADLGCHAHRLERTYRDVRLDGADHYLIVYQVAGHSALTQNDQAVQLAVGDVAVINKAQPVTYFTNYRSAQWFSLRLPRKSAKKDTQPALGPLGDVILALGFCHGTSPIVPPTWNPTDVRRPDQLARLIRHRFICPPLYNPVRRWPLPSNKEYAGAYASAG